MRPKKSGKPPTTPRIGSYTKPFLILSPLEAMRACVSLEPQSSLSPVLFIMVLLCFAPTGSTGQGPRQAPSSETSTPPPTVLPPDETPPQSTAGRTPAAKSGPSAKPPASPATTDNPLPVVPPSNAIVATLTTQRPQIWRTHFPPWPVPSQFPDPASCSPAGGPPPAAPESLKKTGSPLDDALRAGFPMRAGFLISAAVSASHPAAVTPLPVAKQIANPAEWSRPPLSHNGQNRSTFTAKVVFHGPSLLYNVGLLVTKYLQDTKEMGRHDPNSHGIESVNNLVNKCLTSIGPAKCKQVEESPGRKQNHKLFQN